MKKTLSLLLMLSLLLGLSLPAAADAPLQVVTSFYPLHIFAQNILKDVEGVQLNNLTHPTTGCLHDYQLLASDMRTLASADALIINGGGMEPFLGVVAQQFGDMPVIDCSKGIELIAEEELVDTHDHDDHAHEAEEAHDDHDHDHDHDHDEDADGHHGHDHGEFNAHIWLDPKNAAIMARNMAEGLKPLLPGQEARIDENLADFEARLTALDTELRETLKDLPRRDIVTFHEAFPYFARAYGLNVVAVLALEPDEALTPQMLSALVEKVQAHALPPLFTEPQYDDRAARAVAQETGAAIYELDPIVTGDGSPTAYEDGMRKNAQALVEALNQP